MTDSGTFSPQFVQSLMKGEGDVHVRDETGRTVILYAAYYDGKSPNLDLLDILLERDDIPREDKIDALEMAGAVLLVKEEKSEDDVALAFRYWRRALTLRLLDNEDNRPIYKAPLKSMNGSLNEWSTLEDLLRIELDPSQHLTQSLLVQLRIFSSLGWRAVYQHVHPSIQMLLYKGLIDQRLISLFLDLSWVLCNAILQTERPQEEDLRSKLLIIITGLICPLKCLTKDLPISMNSEMFKNIVEIVLMPYPSYFTDTKNLVGTAEESFYLANLCDMVNILSRYPGMMTEDVRLSLDQIIHRDSRDISGRSLLLWSCRSLDSDTLSTIRLLVNLGADVNARKSDGGGVLHVLAMTRNHDVKDATGHLLLELGAHLDLADNDGKTAADLWMEKNKPKKKEDLPDWLQENVPMLKCLCSRVIRRHRIPYKEDNILPVVLVPFVSWH